MILFRLLRRELRQNRGTAVLVLLFITLSALLMAGGAGLVAGLSSALDSMFRAAKAPDVVQMHAGDIDATAVRRWAKDVPDVRQMQIQEMISVDGGSLRLGGNLRSEAESVMDISFVRQNETFDFLLDRENRPASVAPGSVGVPVYYRQRDELELGDTLTLATGSGSRELRVSTFVRDSQMNPSIVHSKRFLVHPDEFRSIGELFPEREYLISFRLHESARTDEFITAYQSSGLPQEGPIVDRGMFRTLSALSDGIIAAVVILVSLVIMTIALLCLRLTILSSIEDDYREIGVMRAIGMQLPRIRRLYLAKYLLLAIVGSGTGYLLSGSLVSLLNRDLTAYLGTPPREAGDFLLPLLAALLVGAIVVFTSVVILRRFGKISPVRALRAEGATEEARRSRALPLRRSRAIELNIFLGLRDIIQRPRFFALLALVFFFAAATVTLPIHFLTTLESPEFISYLGIGRSDLRIDLRHSPESADTFSALRTSLAEDPEVASFSPFTTSLVTLTRPSSSGGAPKEELMEVESGAVATLHLDYLVGGAPVTDREIALSYLKAEDLGVTVGDQLQLTDERGGQRLTVTGIYQDVTNGGRTAKTPARFEAPAIRRVLTVELEPTVEVATKTAELAAALPDARVTDVAGYLQETLGTTIGQLRTVTFVGIAAGFGISALIAALFLQLLLRKDRDRLTIMRSLGFTAKQLRRQYQTTVLGVLLIGIVTGTIFSNTAGQRLVSGLWSLMGAARIEFEIAVLPTYLLIPALFIGVITVAGRATLAQIDKTKGVLK